MFVCELCSMKADLEDRPYQGEKDASVEARVHPDPVEKETKRVQRALRLRVAP